MNTECYYKKVKSPKLQLEPYALYIKPRKKRLNKIEKKTKKKGVKKEKKEKNSVESTAYRHR